MILQVCYEKIVFWTYTLAAGPIDMESSKSQGSIVSKLYIKSLMESHILKRAQDNCYICYVCIQKFANKKALTKHIRG